MDKEQLQKIADEENKRVGYHRHNVRTCIICKKLFVGGSNGVYCTECRDKKGESYELKNDQCAFCGRKTNLHIHHIDCNHENNIGYNLIKLCYLCHNRLHSQIYDKLKKVKLKY